MKCRLCNVVLAPLRSLTDGEFCSDDHRQAFYEQQGSVTRVSVVRPEASLVSLHAAVQSAAPEPPAAPIQTAPAVQPAQAAVPVISSPVNEPRPDPRPPLQTLLPLQFQGQPADAADSPSEFATEPEFPRSPVLPRGASYPLSASVAPEPEIPASASAAEVLGESAIPAHSSRDIAASWQWLRDVWKNAPSDLKVITLLLPVLLAVAVGPSVPKIRITRVAPDGVQQVFTERWKKLHQSILNRAAVAYADDFRSGLDAWDSRSNLTTSWSYDAAGFVQPGPLAVFKPTVDLTDYRFEFLSEIDQKGMGWAFRAADLNNYYAVKFVVVKPGPLPLVHMVRYAVINGKEGPHVDRPLPLTARNDMLYRVLVDVRGSDFTIMAQGQVVDFWSDTRLQRGGVGFFCGRGEKARVRWVEVSHQYDTLGRLCAYLAPYGIEGRNGNWN